MMVRIESAPTSGGIPHYDADLVRCIMHLLLLSTQEVPLSTAKVIRFGMDPGISVASS